jgi:alpha-mannosidase
MTYEELTVLIPCHSLEDFPTELGEQPAEGLLNAFAVLWHPVLLAAAGVMPRWKRADELHDVQPNRLVIVPTASNDWVPHGWVERARRAGANAVSGITERQAMLAAALAPLDNPPAVDPELAADFLAFGACYLQSELLTRHMRNFSHVDEVHLQREAVAAAKAAVQGDGLAAETHLRYCFEMLLECRERFYPVDCYLIDLCLVIPRLADDHLRGLLGQSVPVNLMGTANDWSEIADACPDLIESAKSGLANNRLELVGGEWKETCTPLLSLQTLIWQLQRGLGAFENLFGRRPSTWGRRRFGIDPFLPQLVSRSGMSAALHVAMDDGIYPDQEHSRLRWSGCDGTVIDALSRIPLAGDSAASFLRFPVRMSESMDHDQTAAIVFARWPELRTPWLDDFRRMQKYAPVLGRFVTFRQLFESGGMSGKLLEYKAAEYFSPNLVQSVARQEADPLSRHVDYWSRRARFESLEWSDHMAQLLTASTIDAEQHRQRDEAIELAEPEGSREAVSAAEQWLERLAQSAPQSMSSVLASDQSGGSGCLVINPLSFDRKVPVEWPATMSVPPAAAPVSARQFDDQRRSVVVDVPACGFAWVPSPGQDADRPRIGKTPLAEELVLRNDFFQVNLSEVTGGIGQIRAYGRGGNRISQQVAYRFPRERTIKIGEGEDAEEYRSYYSEMRMDATRVLSAGPAVGEVETTGAILDAQQKVILANYRQLTRVWRGRPIIEIDLELDVKQAPDGDPWTNYYGARFAWKDSTLALSRSLHHGVHGIGGERLEAPQYIELADAESRTTILPMGLPFHRKTGPRMLDTLLITAGETRRTFRLRIAVDVPYPIQAALDAAAPALLIPTNAAPPGRSPTGWLFHLSAGNVQLARILPLRAKPVSDADSEPASAKSKKGCILRLIETEGLRKLIKVHCFRIPTSARQCNFIGETIQSLAIDGDAVHVDIRPYEVCDLEVQF